MSRLFKITSILFILFFIFILFTGMTYNIDSQQKIQHISSYSTKFDCLKKERTYNISLAVSKFCWHLVRPNEELSFNEVVGKRNEENGFKISKVIVDGEYVDGIGGGVCQVSTTLYNAWIRADLDVKKVRNHTLPSSYVDLSLDATVSDCIDLVLFNNTSFNVIVNGYIKEDKIVFDIYGRPLEYKIDIKTKIVKEIKPKEPKIEYLSSLEGLGEPDINNIVTLRKGKNGYISRAYVEYYSKDGKYLYNKMLREDYYVPQNPIYAMLLNDESLD